MSISGSWAPTVFDRSIDAVWALDRYNGFAVILRALKGPIERSAVVETINYTHFCIGDDVERPVAGDYGARVALRIYNLAPGKSSTVRLSSAVGRLSPRRGTEGVRADARYRAAVRRAVWQRASTQSTIASGRGQLSEARRPPKSTVHNPQSAICNLRPVHYLTCSRR